MKLQIKRLISQIILFFSANLGILDYPGLKTGFCYPFFYCQACPAATSACPLRSLEQSVDKQSFEWRLFLLSSPNHRVSWCFNRASDMRLGMSYWITTTRNRTCRKKSKKISHLHRNLVHHKAEKYLRYTKYILLISLRVCHLLSYRVYLHRYLSSWDSHRNIPILILNPGKFVPNYFFPVALSHFHLFFVLIFLIERGWCRYFCPVGALLGPFNKISFLHISVNTKDVHTVMSARM